MPSWAKHIYTTHDRNTYLSSCDSINRVDKKIHQQKSVNTSPPSNPQSHIEYKSLNKFTSSYDNYFKIIRFKLTVLSHQIVGNFLPTLSQAHPPGQTKGQSWPSWYLHLTWLKPRPAP